MFNNAFNADMMLGTAPRDGPNGTNSRFPLGQGINTPILFDKDANQLSTNQFINRTTLEFNDQFYESSKPIYITTMNALEYFSAFTVFTSAIVHVSLWYGKDIMRRVRDVSTLKGNAESVKCEKNQDTRKNPEVPKTLYMFLIGISFLMALYSCHNGFDLPWWGLIFGKCFFVSKLFMNFFMLNLSC
jgi:hypothetical protein